LLVSGLPEPELEIPLLLGFAVNFAPSALSVFSRRFWWAVPLLFDLDEFVFLSVEDCVFCDVDREDDDECGENVYSDYCEGCECVEH
jgi:hypothetical protein